MFSTTPEQTQSLEYQAYEGLVRAQLEKQGLRGDEGNAAATFKVEFSASVTGRDVRIIETVLVDSWYGTPWYGPGFYSPYWGYPGLPILTTVWGGAAYPWRVNRNAGTPYSIGS